MAYSLENKLVIGVSSRALFDMSKENAIFEAEGAKSFVAYEREHEDDILLPGPGFPLVRSLLQLNDLPGGHTGVEVIVMSRNSPDSSLRVFNAIEHYGLSIARAVLVSGAQLAPYLSAFRTDLFLSAYEDDVQSAVNSGIAAGIIFGSGLTEGETYSNEKGSFRQIRIAFDGDAVLFANDSEKVYQEGGLEAFEQNEKQNARNPLSAGPFAKFLKTISELQNEYSEEESPIRTALVTSRSAPAHERVIRTLRAWDVRIDEAFFLGGIPKKEVLKAFRADIFFDDQDVHTNPAAGGVPSARVPWVEAKKEA